MNNYQPSVKKMSYECDFLGIAFYNSIQWIKKFAGPLLIRIASIGIRPPWRLTAVHKTGFRFFSAKNTGLQDFSLRLSAPRTKSGASQILQEDLI
jgi:hypothetical protein